MKLKDLKNLNPNVKAGLVKGAVSGVAAQAGSMAGRAFAAVNGDDAIETEESIAENVEVEANDVPEAEAQFQGQLNEVTIEAGHNAQAHVSHDVAVEDDEVAAEPDVIAEVEIEAEPEVSVAVDDEIEVSIEDSYEVEAGSDPFGDFVIEPGSDPLIHMRGENDGDNTADADPDYINDANVDDYIG